MRSWRGMRKAGDDFPRGQPPTKNSMMTTLPIDDVPVSCPTWADIAGKAHLYKTARLRSTGEYVSIIGVRRYADGLELVTPAFLVRPINGTPETRTTEELCDFGL
jgi:hypothetical protein